MNYVPAAEAARVLREIVQGTRALVPADPRRAWGRVAVGEVEYRAGDARCTFFADHATLDHLAAIALADGRRGGFADWMREDGSNPVDLLAPTERDALEQLLYTGG